MNFITSEEEISQSSKTRVLYFCASWMPFSKRMLKVIESLEKKYTNIQFQAIDVDFFKNLCIRFNVTSIPVILIFKDNKEVTRANGLILSSALKKVFVDICKV